MNNRSDKFRQIITIFIITVFALTSVPLATDSFAARVTGRIGSSTRVERNQDRRAVRDQDRRAVRDQDRRAVRDQNRRTVRDQDRRPVRSQQRKSIRDQKRRSVNDYTRRSSRQYNTVKRKYEKRIISPRIIRHGHTVRRLPRGYKRSWYKGVPYYYLSGIFYRPGLSGFIAVKAPIGLIVVSLPVGYQSIWVDGSVYYVYGGVFYRRVPTGFVVVQPPETVVVEDASPDIIEPSQTATGEVSVAVPVLNVRSGPSLSDPKIYQINEGYILDIHGRSDGWLYVELPDGEFGWVKEEYTKPVEPGSG